ncbi:MAG TPA: histone deacetylase [Candidatus Baltobacteraceae bacterium]|nr:histone deacetylase [Candidatus Baltobacteraceae bacterium]
MTIITDEQCAGYARAGHPERPQRILTTIERLKNQKELPVEWVKPTTKVSDEHILRAHSAEMLARLKIPHDFDADTPAYENIETYARASVSAALNALKICRAGKNVFSLMRPPGHHATRGRQMGFCYLNNVAIAVLEAMATSAKRVAVFDFDVHHGNGTEDIFLNRDGIAFFSIHQFPCYPGTGAANAGKNCFNYPVAPSTSREDYRATLAQALADLKKFSADLIAVSAGFDAYARDPLAEGSLLVEDFYWLGKELRVLEIPFLSLLEGGYNNDLPELILAYLKGVEGIPQT